MPSLMSIKNSLHSGRPPEACDPQGSGSGGTAVDLALIAPGLRIGWTYLVLAEVVVKAGGGSWRSDRYGETARDVRPCLPCDRHRTLIAWIADLLWARLGTCYSLISGVGREYCRQHGSDARG